MIFVLNYFFTVPATSQAAIVSLHQNPSPSSERPPQSQHCLRICLEFLVGKLSPVVFVAFMLLPVSLQ